MFKSPKLHEVTKELAAVALGKIPAELVIKNTKLVNVNTHEIQENSDIAIICGRIAYIGNADHTIGKDTKVVDAVGKYAVPGLIDGHIHVESSMMTVSNYAKAVIPHGTTTIYADPHEIANVLGTKGVDFMLEDGKNTPMRFYVAMPSCVPAVVEFEDNGAKITSEDIEKYMQREDICGLGELMNFPGVLNGDEEMHNEIKATLKHNKTVTGHYSMPENDRGLNAYIASGVSCCHETVRKEDAIAKMRLGMYVQIREGSAWRDLKEVVRAVTETSIDTRFATVVSDDTHPHTLIEQGHMDHTVRRLIEEGVNPITAVQMGTINVAECFGMARDLGSISPGKCADILLVSDLSRMKVDSVYISGVHVAENGKMNVEIKGSNIPDWALKSVKIDPLKPENFIINAPKTAKEKVCVNVVEIIEAKVGTYARKIEMPVINGEVKADAINSILKFAVIERHTGSNTIGKGFVKGFHIENGAVASTVAHDAHNISIAGDNDSDMALAGNTLREYGGGMVAVQNGKVIALLPLPIAGIMTDENAEDIAKKVAELDEAWKTLGCNMISPFMTMALIPLSVLPELRITNRGVIDTINYKITDLFV